MIVLKPCGGLCNRLRALDSARVLSSEIHQPLEVRWTLSPELNCSFYALFEPSEDYKVIDVAGRRPPSFEPLRKALFVRDYARARLNYHHVIFQSRMSRLLTRKYDFLQLKHYHSSYIMCCDRFYRTERKCLPLNPVSAVHSIIRRFKDMYSPHTVGIHIRRTDHCSLNPYVDKHLFIDEMDKEIEQYPETKFFLASDSQEIMSHMISLFGDRIIWHDKVYDRNNPKGIQDALIDLFCLSETRKIIGTYLSSFSETAAQINDIPFYAVGEPK